ncbi:MAG: RidA family protein [Saprospiraceae bacterium]|nr:RidA family protein [Saprospiraceae bacterium]
MKKNPFTNDPDKSAIWTMLVERDIIAFCHADWEMVSHDFIASGFMGIDGNKIADPDQWSIGFPDLVSYKNEWLRQAQMFKESADKTRLIEEFNALTDLSQIEINGDTALAHKKFDGYFTNHSGDQEYLNWQTLYQCRKVDQQWKICGFMGYLPFPLGDQRKSSTVKKLPSGAQQHKTAGPYSPVLEINSNKLVVISGQAALNMDGNVVGATIEEQTEVTLQNCLSQLEKANCTFDDVFKVNVYLKDLADWPRFNEIYQKHFIHPMPVRTAVQTPLLLTFLVEIEMWAAK